MRNLTTKLLVALTCVAFASVQYASADYVSAGGTTGQVLSGADILGHTGGLESVTKTTNSATLNFNGNTRVDWGRLNVNKNETLNFKNGDFAVLNTVRTGASRFAGKVIGENGKIIIANPNGMIFTGGNAAGTFAGNLILTTKNLAGVEANQIAGLNIDQIKAATNGTEFGVVALKDGASITAGQDITIIANGVSIDNAKLLSQNGSVLVTSDGANYVLASDNKNAELKGVINDEGVVATETAKMEKGQDGFIRDSQRNVTSRSIDAPVYIVSSDVTANGTNGEINISVQNPSAAVTAKSIKIDSSTLTAKDVKLASGDANITDSSVPTPGDSVLLNNSTVNGNLDIKADKFVNISSGEVNGDTNIESTKIYIIGARNNYSAFNGNLTLKDTLDDYNASSNKYVYLQRANIDGDLTINEGADISSTALDPVYVYDTKAENADISGESIYLRTINFGDADLNAYGTVALRLNNTINGNLNIKTSTDTPNTGMVVFGFPTISSDNSPQAGQVGKNNQETTNVAGDLNIESGSTIAIAADVQVGGKANLTSHRSSVIVADTEEIDTNTGRDIVCGINGHSAGATNDENVVINAPASKNELIPLSGDIKGDGIQFHIKDHGVDKDIYVSSFYKEMLEDYVEKPSNVTPGGNGVDVPDDESEKNLTNLVQNGVDASSAQSFTPIAFAADDEQPDNVKRIAKIVFKTPDGVVSISDRLIQKDINGSF